jgi:hypothetical protein
VSALSHSCDLVSGGVPCVEADQEGDAVASTSPVIYNVARTPMASIRSA